MEATQIKAFSTRTPEDIYLEWCNDWITTKAMAENYNRTELEMAKIVRQGQLDHKKRFE